MHHMQPHNHRALWAINDPFPFVCAHFPMIFAALSSILFGTRQGVRAR
jgi:hypothetical protein